MKTHPLGHPVPTTVPTEQKVRTCRAALETPPGEGSDESSQNEPVVRSED